MTIKKHRNTKKLSNYDDDEDKSDLTMLFKKENNIICFYCSIDRDSWLKFDELLDEMNNDSSVENIILRISSSGGSVSYAFTIASLIEHNKKPIYGIVDSTCCSAALFLILACKTRQATRCSEFLIHEGWSDDQLSTSELIQKYNAEIILEKETKDYIISKTKINSKQYDKINRNEISFYSGDAIKYGIISDTI